MLRAALPLLLLLSLASAARAAGVVTLRVFWDGTLDVQSSLGVPIGAIAFSFDGADGFAFASPLPNVSLLDSGYALDPLGDGRNALSIVNVANGVSILNPGQEVVFGQFTSFDLSQFDLYSGDDYYGATLFDVSLNAIPAGFTGPGPCPPGYEYECRANGISYLLTVPEPAVVILGALAALSAAGRAAAAARRSARRRSA